MCLITSNVTDPNDAGHHPFHRLKLKPVNRMSCVVDYETSNGTLRRMETEGAEKRRINSRGLTVTGGGGTLRRNKDKNGGGQTREDKTWGLCYLCQEPASIQVSGGSDQSEAS